jgi:hypothetical protein
MRESSEGDDRMSELKKPLPIVKIHYGPRFEEGIKRAIKIVAEKVKKDLRKEM